MSTLKFRGFALAKLVRAVNAESNVDDPKKYSYEIEMYSKYSRPEPKQLTMKVHEINSTFGKEMRMAEDCFQHAVQRGSNDWELISQEEFRNLLKEWSV